MTIRITIDYTAGNHASDSRLERGSHMRFYDLEDMDLTYKLLEALTRDLQDAVYHFKTHKRPLLDNDARYVKL